MYIAKHYLSSKKFAAVNLKFRAAIGIHNNQILLRNLINAPCIALIILYRANFTHGMPNGRVSDRT